MSHIAAGHPLTESNDLLGMLRCDLVVDFREIEDILDAILAIVGIEWSLTEEIDLSLGPHLVETIFVPIYAVTGLVSLQDLV